jgi:glutaminyl-tRNA synthetase
MRRRGFTPESIRHFCEAVGVSRSEGVVDISMLEHAIREDLDTKAPRIMCVLRPLKVVITNLPADHDQLLSMANHPKNEAMGRRDVPFTQELFIDETDFEEVPPAGFKRLIPGGEVRLRGCYVMRCDSVEKDSSGAVVQVNCSIDPDTLGKNPEGRKVKGVIHWVSASKGVAITTHLYDRLFTVEEPGSKEYEDYKVNLNPDSLQVLTKSVIEPAAVEPESAGQYQFEREGYFCLDSAKTAQGQAIFNRTITLRDSWSSR